MTPDPDHTRPINPADPATFSFDPALAAAFGPDHTPGGFTLPPLLRDDPSELATVVQPSSAEMPKGGTQRYQLHGEIARGGMGVVLKGRDPDLGRDLAFKVLRVELAHKPAAVQRFVEEAQIGGQLQHPGVVPVYDLGRYPDGRPYFAMKLVKGRTLADLFAARRSPADDRGRMLHTFLQVCQTVAYAHAKGVIHRDLKPSNVMVGAFGEVLVMDWGLAKVLPRGGIADEEKASMASGGRKPPGFEEPTVIHTARSGSGGAETQAGSVMGTPAFMPPEQAGGEIDKLDERADVFGLGAMLCVLLTGKPPYVADTSDEVRLMAVRGKLADAFARLDGCGADAELVSLCKRCLSAEREDRPRHAGEVVAAISSHLSEVELRAHRAEVELAAAEARAAEETNTRHMAEAKTVEERKRRRTQLALAASVAAAVGLVGFGLWWEDRRNEAHRTQESLRVAAEDADLLRRQTATERDVASALDTMRAIIADARKHEDNPDQMKLTLRTARSYLDRAEASVQTGAPTDAVREQVAVASAGMTQADKDAKLLAALAAIGRQSRENLLPGLTKTGPACEAAFREYGVDVLNAPMDEVAAHVQNHPHFIHLYLALMSWEFGYSGGPKEGSPEHQRLFALGQKLVLPPDSGIARIMAIFRQGRLTGLIPLSRSPEIANWKPVELKWLAVFMIPGRPDEQREKLAFDVLRKAVEWHPADFDLNLFLGGWLAESPRREDQIESLRYLTAAYSLNPRHATVTHQITIAYGGLGDHETALRWAQRTINLDPKSEYGVTNLAATYLSLRRYPEAINEAVKAIERRPSQPNAYRILDDALKQLKTPAERAAILGQKIEGREVPPEAKVRLALAHLEANSRGPAEQLLAGLRTELRTNRQGLIEVSGLLLRANQPAAALPFLETCAGLKPTHANDHKGLGYALMATGRDDDAIREYRTAIKLDPTDPHPHSRLGWIFWGRKGDLERAASEYREALGLAPALAAERNEYGIVLQSLGRVDEAVEQYVKATIANPTTPDPHLRLGSLYLNQYKRPELAVPYFQRAAELTRGKPGEESRSRNDLGCALRDAGRRTEAVREFERAATLDDTNPFPHRNLGDISAQRQAPEKTIAHYRKAIQLAPENPGFNNELAWFLATGPDARFRDGKEAVRLASIACELTTWNEANFIDTLAAAHAEAGDFDKAIEYQKKTLNFPAFEKAHGVPARGRIEQYQKKQPYRDPAFAREVLPPPREDK